MLLLRPELSLPYFHVFHRKLYNHTETLILPVPSCIHVTWKFTIFSILSRMAATSQVTLNYEFMFSTLTLELRLPRHTTRSTTSFIFKCVFVCSLPVDTTGNFTSTVPVSFPSGYVGRFLPYSFNSRRDDFNFRGCYRLSSIIYDFLI